MQEGIDISSFQDHVPDGDWLFVVAKATEGITFTDPRLSDHWVHAARFPHRGTYHYARPGDGHTGTEQADFFARVSLGQGFRPDTDLWQLDVETEGNEGVLPATWRTFIDAFMGRARAQLGRVGFLYIGWPMYQQIWGVNDLSALRAYPWWLPAYGPNDGEVHALPTGVNPDLVVLHQFTSHGGLDRNRVVNQPTWESLVVPRPTFPPRYDPPLTLQPIVADCRCPTGGAWLVAADGAVYAFGGAPYHGGANGQPFFAGRQVAFIAPNERGGYTLVDTAGETYAFPV